MKANKNVELQLLGLKHRDELYSLVEANRTHLRKWLPWLDANRTSADTESFIKSAISQHEAGKGPHYAVFDGMVMCGVCGFNPVDVTNKVGGIVLVEPSQHRKRYYDFVGEGAGRGWFSGIWPKPD